MAAEAAGEVGRQKQSNGAVDGVFNTDYSWHSPTQDRDSPRAVAREVKGVEKMEGHSANCCLITLQGCTCITGGGEGKAQQAAEVADGVKHGTVTKPWIMIR